MTNQTHEVEQVKVSLEKQENVQTPFYATAQAAGLDVCAFISENITLLPQQTVVIPTGLKMAIPEGFEIQVRPRSGLALKHGITVLNTPGTIDADYRGEIKVILINHGALEFVITPGMRIAQLVLSKVYQAVFKEESLSETARGEGGFGHTGRT